MWNINGPQFSNLSSFSALHKALAEETPAQHLLLELHKI